MTYDKNIALEVLNVGQGDSILWKPESTCAYYGRNVFFDLGTGKNDVTKYMDPNKDIHIFLTHHDSDHTGGLHYFADKFDKVKEIIVPFYQNEITLLAKAILNLKGMSSSRECGEYINSLNDIENNQLYLKYLNEQGIFLKFAYQGKYFDKHLECLNPPFLIDTYNWLYSIDDNRLENVFNELFTDDFANMLRIYIRAMRSEMDEFDSEEIRKNYFFIENDNLYDPRVLPGKANFVLDFIFNNIVLLRRFNYESTRKNMRKIYNKYIKCTHDVSLVFMIYHKNNRILMAGDASKKVFNRLITEGENIEAEYIKIPHHGSKKNIDAGILSAINPSVAIISHNNRQFGRCKDTHPHKEVLDMLRNGGVRVLLTNDVKKNGIIYMEKKKHQIDKIVKIH